MDRVISNIEGGIKHVNEMDYTGPYLFKRAYCDFEGVEHDSLLEPRVHDSKMGKVMLLDECRQGWTFYVSYDCSKKVNFAVERLMWSKYSEYHKDIGGKDWFNVFKKDKKVYREECLSNKKR